MAERPRGHRRRLVWRYAQVGAAATVIDVGLTLALAGWLHYLLANTLAFVLANLFNFVAAHTYVFGLRMDRAALRARYLPVLAISAAGLALNDAAIWVLVEPAGWALLPAKLLATALVLGWNFGARLATVYRDAL